MKIIRIVLATIILSSLLLTIQPGQVQGNASFIKLNPIVTNNHPELGVQTNLPTQVSVSNAMAAALNPQTGSCHFGITVPLGLNSYDLSILGVDSYLDWWNGQKASNVAGNIEYYRVVNVSDAMYDNNYNNLPTMVAAAPKGSVWIIGNEPDSEVAYQDHISAQSYGTRYFNMATRIRNLDATARIGFGSVIQPTPVRLYYLNLALDAMTALAGGSRANALSLIDIFSIHSFILNEHPIKDQNGNTISWGAGVPIGYNSSWPAYQVIDGTQTYDINLFTSRVTAFRQWMKNLGQQQKPLWITEYGSLFPTWLSVSDLTSATFMNQTFDFMLGTKDAALGYANDSNRLVQKWLWYSLNDSITHFGGSLYNPQNHYMTLVGQYFKDYNPSLSAVPATNSDAYIDTSSIRFTGGPNGGYVIWVKVGNNVSMDRLTNVKVDLFNGTTLVGTVTTNLPRCAGKTAIPINIGKLPGGVSYAFRASVSIISSGDIDPTNNEFTFPPIFLPILKNVYFPIIR